MSTRSAQARQMARDLHMQWGVDVEVLHGGQNRWYVQWCNGPTWKQMMESVAPMLSQYPLLADRRLTSSRSTSPTAWAARAAAALRDGSLARAVAEYQPSSLIKPDGPLTADMHAALRLIEQVLEDTADPEKPSAPADVEVLAHLLAAGPREDRHGRRYASEFNMVGPLLRLLHGPPPVPDALPENVVPLFGKKENHR